MQKNAFSKENWDRPQKEVDALMDLFRQYLKEDLAELSKQKAAIHFIGNKTRFPADIRRQMNEWEDHNPADAQMHLILAMGYSGRDEIATAVKRLAEDVKAGILSSSSIDEGLVSAYLTTSDFPDPDLPKTQVNFPSSMTRLTSLRASTAPSPLP